VQQVEALVAPRAQARHALHLIVRVHEKDELSARVLQIVLEPAQPRRLGEHERRDGCGIGDARGRDGAHAVGDDRHPRAIDAGIGAERVEASGEVGDRRAGNRPRGSRTAGPCSRSPSSE
jgi:hypothetical protein